MSEKVFLTDQDCIAAAKDVCTQLLSRADAASFSGIAVVLNGGFIPAYWLRKLLGIAGVDLPLALIDVRSYHDYMQQGAIEAVMLPDLGDGQGWIIIDEVCDTGNTFAFLQSHYPRAVYASLTVKEKGRGVVDHFGLSFAQDQWLVFPWEVED
jgi:xanthine phosphoribosyltransferase